MALRESEELYRAFFSTSRDCVYITSVDGGWVGLNDVAVHFFGYDSKEDLLKVEIKDLYANPDERTRHLQVINEKGYTQEYPVALRKKDGTIIDTLITSVTRKDSTGRIIGYQGTVRDITERKHMEEALASEKERLEVVTQNIGAGLAIISRDYRTLWANKVLQNIFGECVGKVCYNHYYQREEICSGCGVRDILDTGAENSVHEQVGRDFAGNTIWYQIIATPLRDKGGNLTAVLELVVHITERKRAEEAWRESERKFHEVVTYLDEGYYSVTLDGLLLDHNQAFNRILGVDISEDMKGAKLADFWQNPDERNEYLNELMSRGFIRNYLINAKTISDEKIVVLVNSHLVKDEKGRVLRIEGTFIDFTERKLAEEALKESEERYRNLVERANDGIVIIQDGLIKYANSQTGMIWDSTVEEIVGKSFIDYVYPDEIPKLVERYQRRMANEYVAPTYETILRRKDGSKIFAELNAGLITFEGKPADLIIVRDITERKRADDALRKAHDELEMRVKERTEELARKNTEMERFIYTVSHDLRTPLISISGFLGFIMQDTERGDLDRLKIDLRIANEAVKKMDRLLMETLELSRIGRVVNLPEDIPFGEIVEDALGQTGEIIKSKGCKVSVAQNLPVVHVDRMRIAEVLVNLIENSMKYIGVQANPEIEIGQRIDGKDRIFFVRDNGIGIDPSQYDKVFELFYKVEKKSEGTGAGLAIVKRIIEVHGGRIWIESELGEGCTVCFTLPLA